MVRNQNYEANENRYNLTDRIFNEVKSVSSATTGQEVMNTLEEAVAFWTQYVERPAKPLSDPHEVWIDFIGNLANMCTLKYSPDFLEYGAVISQKTAMFRRVHDKLEKESPYSPENLFGEELGKFFYMIHYFDYYYRYSDDISVYRAGAAQEKQINELKDSTPQHAALYKTMMRIYQ